MAMEIDMARASSLNSLELPLAVGAALTAGVLARAQELCHGGNNDAPTECEGVRATMQPLPV